MQPTAVHSGPRDQPNSPNPSSKEPLHVLQTQTNSSSIDSATTTHNDTNLGRGFRTKFPNVKHKDFVIHTIFTKSPSLPNNSSPRHPSGTPYPIAHYVNCNSYSLRYRNFIAAIISGKEPRSFKEAMQDEGWRKSMQNEIRALENNGTWTMEDLPPGKKPLGSQ